MPGEENTENCKVETGRSWSDIVAVRCGGEVVTDWMFPRQLLCFISVGESDKQPVLSSRIGGIY